MFTVSICMFMKSASLNPNRLTLICDLDLLSRAVTVNRVSYISYSVVYLFQTSLARPFVPFQANPAELLGRFAKTKILWSYCCLLFLVLLVRGAAALVESYYPHTVLERSSGFPCLSSSMVTFRA